MSVKENPIQLNLVSAILENDTKSLKYVMKNPVDINFYLPLGLTENHLTDNLVSLFRGLNDKKSDLYVCPKIKPTGTSSFYDILMSHSKYTPLHLAVRYCNLDMITFLLKKGADPNACNSVNETPLINSFMNGKINFLNLVKLFVKFGADISFQGGKSNHNVLHKALMYYKKDPLYDNDYLCSDVTFRWLVANGVDINARTSEGQTCLHMAVLRDRIDLVNELVGLGAKCLKDNNNQTPLHFIPRRKIVEQFMSKEVDTNIRDINGNTALHLTAIEGFPYLYSFLNNYSNLNLKDRNGSTVLHIICKKNKSNCLSGVEPLFDLDTVLQHGADVNITDDKGFTPYYYLLQSSDGYEFIDKIPHPLTYLTFSKKWYSSPREMFILHLYKLHKVGMLVQGKPCVDVFDKIWFKKYDKKCDIELNNMAHCLIDEYGIQFSQILTNNINILLEYNSIWPGLLKCLSKMLLQIRDEFPLYSDIIENQVYKASLHLYYRRVQKIGEFVVHQILPSMPALVVRNILKFIPPDEIIDLNNAIKNTKNIINPRKRKSTK